VEVSTAAEGGAHPEAVHQYDRDVERNDGGLGERLKTCKTLEGGGGKLFRHEREAGSGSKR
jgi:hypothetical protein